jgi:diacylglycerol kinase (ATP)
MQRAFASSAKGFVGAFRDEQAFRQELLFACLTLPLGMWLGHSGVEATVDRIGLERHELAGLAKDIGSAAVMLSFILLGVVWLLVLAGR